MTERLDGTGLHEDAPGIAASSYAADEGLLAELRASWPPIPRSSTRSTSRGANMAAAARCGCRVAGGLYVLAPVERFSSAEQGALMIREGPRRQAVACETGDWSHVDVYLTKSLDYRAILFAGSRWDDQALEWLAKRRATVVAVGGDMPTARGVIRYPGDDDPEVARYTEVLVPELLAATWWRQQG